MIEPNFAANLRSEYDHMGDDVDPFDEWASRPYRPNRRLVEGNGRDVGERVADALEYIAAQLGEICHKMDHIGSGYVASKQDLEQMKDLLRKL